MSAFKQDVEDKISAINADLKDKMGFFDSDSDASDDSYHSTENDNLNPLSFSTSENRLQDGSPESNMTNESQKSYWSNQSSSIESNNLVNSSSELNELYDAKPFLPMKQSKESIKESNFISELNEEQTRQNQVMEDEMEFDIMCLKSLKERDEQNEAILEKLCEDLDEEKLKGMRAEAADFRKAGNQLFADADFVAAVAKYNEGLAVCPLFYPEDRAMLCHNRAAAYQKMEENKMALYGCTKAVGLWPEYLKCLVRKAKLHETLDELDAALEGHRKVLELEPRNAESRNAVYRLPPLIAERNEKMKEECLGKLKELGNMVLKPFGLSTNNFQFQQDPDTGGYNMKFQQ